MSSSWFRSWHGAPTDTKWRTIARRAKVRPGDVFAVVSYLWDRASQCENRGTVEGYDVEVIADSFGYEPEEVGAIISALIDKQVIVEGRISAWEKYQPKREDDNSTNRVKEFRARQKETQNQENIGDETHVTTMKRTETLEESRVDTDIISSLRSDIIPLKTREAEILPLAKPKTSQRSQIAPDAQPSHENLEFAANEGLPIGQVRLEWAKFRDHHRSLGNLMADWSAAWRKWVRNSKQFAHPRGSPVHAATPAEPQNAVIRSLMRQKQRESDEQLNYSQ